VAIAIDAFQNIKTKKRSIALYGMLLLIKNKWRRLAPPLILLFFNPKQNFYCCANSQKCDHTFVN